jgi:hypothetical protein
MYIQRVLVLHLWKLFALHLAAKALLCVWQWLQAMLWLQLNAGGRVFVHVHVRAGY